MPANLEPSKLEHNSNVNIFPNPNSKLYKQKSSASLDLKITGRFMLIMGTAAVIAAFVFLNALTFGIAGTTVAVAGAATALIGYGLFKKGWEKNNPFKQHYPNNVTPA